MNIYYNGLENPTKLVTLTEVPNILKVENDDYGTYASIELEFNGVLSASADGQYHITIFGEVISNTLTPSMAKNKRFFISNDEDSTAMSVCKALRNCGGIGADFKIVHSGNGVQLIAKTIGNKSLSNNVSTDIPNTYLEVSISEGTAPAVYNSTIMVDVYNGSANDDNYVTTLEKNWYGDGVMFDVSPVLATFSEYGKTKPYELALQMIKSDGGWQYLGKVSGNTSIGYHINDSNKYLTATSSMMVFNKNMGQKFYTYSNVIPYSVLKGTNEAGYTLTVSVLNSAFENIYSATTQVSYGYGTNLLFDRETTIPQSAFTQGYYVDITVGNDTTRFNIIKPLKATEYYQRVLWRNEYGGIQYFDFTSTRSESNSIDSSLYQKNLYDYYDTNDFEYEDRKVYSKTLKKTFTLESHLIEKEGKYIFSSLAVSKKVWTIVNGKKYPIIIESVEVNEDNSYNGVYKAKVVFSFSDLTAF